MRDLARVVVLEGELHEVALAGHRQYGVGEAAVNGGVGVPPLSLVAKLARHVVQQRPDAGVGEAFVEARLLVGGEEQQGRGREPRHGPEVDRRLAAASHGEAELPLPAPEDEAQDDLDHRPAERRALYHGLLWP